MPRTIIHLAEGCGALTSEFRYPSYTAHSFRMRGPGAGKWRGISLGWKIRMEIKVELMDAIYPKAWDPCLLQQRGVMGSLRRSPSGPRSVLESVGSPALPSTCSRGSSQGRNHQILSLSTSIVHSGEAGVFHIFEERGKRGPWPLVCPLLLEEGCAGRWAARPWKHKS